MERDSLEDDAGAAAVQRPAATPDPLVRETYADDWDALVKDFEPQNAANWQELDRGGMLWLRPGGNGIRAMRRFLGVVAERYYQLMRDAIRKLDPDAMYLGDRYQSFYYPEARRQPAGSIVDVVSTNLNASWNDGTFLNSYLDTLHKLTGKPIIVSEFYMAAAENSSGNQEYGRRFSDSGNPTRAASMRSPTRFAHWCVCRTWSAPIGFSITTSRRTAGNWMVRITISD